MSQSVEQGQSKWLFSFYKSFIVDECSSYSKMTVFETLDSERRRK